MCAHIYFVRVRHYYDFPEELGGGCGYSDLGMFIDSLGWMLEVLEPKDGEKNRFGRIQKWPKGKGYVFTPVKNPEKYFDIPGDEPEDESEDKPNVLEFGDWLDYMHKEDYEIAIQDIEDLKPGDQVKLLMLHRNIGDIVCNPNENPCDCVTEPRRFFKAGIVTYTHEKDLHGTIEDEYGVRPFNFHLNYTGNRWYPLEDDGLLPIKTGEASIRNAVADYRKYPKTTKIGCRGPMLFVRDLDNAPCVYHH